MIGTGVRDQIRTTHMEFLATLISQIGGDLGAKINAMSMLALDTVIKMGECLSMRKRS